VNYIKKRGGKMIVQENVSTERMIKIARKIKKRFDRSAFIQCSVWAYFEERLGKKSCWRVWDGEKNREFSSWADVEKWGTERDGKILFRAFRKKQEPEKKRRVVKETVSTEEILRIAEKVKKRFSRSACIECVVWTYPGEDLAENSYWDVWNGKEHRTFPSWIDVKKWLEERGEKILFRVFR
jgi:hypothetical protein